jgi:polysaccharide pyruvyl transferase CsaB
MASRGKIFDVLLAGYFGFGNLGDELIIDAALKNLETLGVPRRRVAILSNDTGGCARRGAGQFERWNPLSVLRALGASRVMLMPGGGLFQDATSARSCAYYWWLVRAARVKSVPVAALGQSVGPLRRQVSRFLTRDALARCAFVSARDSASSKILSELRVPHETAPDIVMSVAEPPLASGGGAALINIRRERSEEYSTQVLRAAGLLHSAGTELICVAMSRDDEALMRGLRESGRLPECEIVTPESADEFFEVSHRARAAVGMRLHFGILSLLAGLNVALAPYDPKVSSFAGAWGIKQLKKEDFDEDFDIMRLLTNSRFRDKKIFEEIRGQVAEQFRRALDPILGEGYGRGETRRA